MDYAITITDETTGESVLTTREESQDEYWNDQPRHSSIIFSFTEHNWFCDCNRGLDFWRAKGLTEKEIDELDTTDEDGNDTEDNPFHCGHDRYSVLIQYKGETILEDKRNPAREDLQNPS